MMGHWLGGDVPQHMGMHLVGSVSMKCELGTARSVDLQLLPLCAVAAEMWGDGIGYVWSVVWDWLFLHAQAKAGSTSARVHVHGARECDVYRSSLSCQVQFH